MLKRVSFSLVLALVPAASFVSAAQSNSGWRRVGPPVAAPASNPPAGEFQQAPQSDMQQFGTVRFRIPPGWTSRQVADSVMLAPSSAAAPRPVITVDQGYKPAAGFRAEFERKIAGMKQLSHVQVESLPGKGYEILQAEMRYEGNAVIVVAANPFGRFEKVSFSVFSEQTFNTYLTYLPVFERFLQSLEYLPDASPQLPAPPSPAPPAGRGPAAPPAGQPPAGIELAQPAGNGIGAKYGTRDPRVCKSTKKPVSGPISAEEAKQYVICDDEYEIGFTLKLVENIGVEVGMGRRVTLQDIYDYDEIDPNGFFYPIRGSYSIYDCSRIAGEFGHPNYIGRNCSKMVIPQAHGACYRTAFGDWKCRLYADGGNITHVHDLPPPPAR